MLFRNGTCIFYLRHMYFTHSSHMYNPQAGSSLLDPIFHRSTEPRNVPSLPVPEAGSTNQSAAPEEGVGQSGRRACSREHAHRTRDTPTGRETRPRYERHAHRTRDTPTGRERRGPRVPLDTRLMDHNRALARGLFFFSLRTRCSFSGACARESVMCVCVCVRLHCICVCVCV